jgi:hypothetical protein
MVNGVSGRRAQSLVPRISRLHPSLGFDRAPGVRLRSVANPEADVAAETELIDVIVEIPAGTPNKYETDREAGRLRLEGNLRFAPLCSVVVAPSDFRVEYSTILKWIVVMAHVLRAGPGVRPVTRYRVLTACSIRAPKLATWKTRNDPSSANDTDGCRDTVCNEFAHQCGQRLLDARVGEQHVRRLRARMRPAGLRGAGRLLERWLDRCMTTRPTDPRVFYWIPEPNRVPASGPSRDGDPRRQQWRRRNGGRHWAPGVQHTVQPEVASIVRRARR